MSAEDVFEDLMGEAAGPEEPDIDRVWDEAREKHIQHLLDKDLIEKHPDEVEDDEGYDWPDHIKIWEEYREIVYIAMGVLGGYYFSMRQDDPDNPNVRALHEAMEIFMSLIDALDAEYGGDPE